MAEVMFCIPLRVPDAQLAPEMRPLVKQLASRFGNSGPESTRCRDTRRIERVPSRFRLLMNGLQVRVHCRARIREDAKPNELRVARVASSTTEKDGLSQQCFPPAGHQTCWVEVSRMERPEPHSGLMVSCRVQSKPMAVFGHA